MELRVRMTSERASSANVQLQYGANFFVRAASENGPYVWLQPASENGGLFAVRSCQPATASREMTLESRSSRGLRSGARERPMSAQSQHQHERRVAESHEEIIQRFENELAAGERPSIDAILPEAADGRLKLLPELAA